MKYSSERGDTIGLLIAIGSDDPELVDDLMMQLPKVSRDATDSSLCCSEMCKLNHEVWTRCGNKS